MRRPGILLVAGLALAAMALLPDVARSARREPGTLRLVGTIDLPGDGYIDYLTLAPGTHTLYAAHTSRTELVAIDTNTNSIKASIGGLPGVREVALAPDRGLGYTSNRGNDTVGVIDLAANRLLGTIPAGHGPDAILYDDAARLVYVADHEGKTATLIDPAAGRVLATVPLGGVAEFAQADPGSGRVFQNLEDRNEIAVVDPAKRSVVKRFALSRCESPTGLAYDRTSRRLFCACSNEKLLVLDAEDGRIVAILPIGAGVDFAAYDPGLKRVYTANGRSGTITVIGVIGNDRYRVLEDTRTFPGGHSLAVDPVSHRVYLAHGGRIAVYDALLPR